MARVKPKNIVPSDAYAIKFEIKDGDYWKRGEEIYIANGKNKHDQVRRLFKEAHKGRQTNIISVCYQ